MDLLKIMTEYRALKRIPRTGWLTCDVGLTAAETVANHTLDVAFISLMLSGTFKKRGYKVNEAKLLKIALLHDLPEAKTFDIPYPGRKYFKGKKEMEEMALEDLLNECRFDEKLAGEYVGLWRSKGKTLEGKIVNIADLLSMLFEHIALRNQGFCSKKLDEHFTNCLGDIAPYISEFGFLKEMVEEIRKEIEL